MSYSVLPSRFLNWFDETIHSVAWQQTKFLNWFMGFPGTTQSNGPVSGRGNKIEGPLIQSVEEGLEQVITWEWEKMAPGQIGGSLQEAPIQRPRIKETTIQLCYLVTRLAFSIQQVDAWRHNKYIAAGQLIPAAIRQAMLPLTNQVDQFICFGDDMKNPLAFDRLGGAGKFTGLFNGFSTFATGTGADNDMGAAGDLISTYVNARSNLRAQGFDKGPYYILSDEVTQSYTEKGNMLYTSGTKPITEYSAFMGEYRYKQGQVADWIESVNAYPGSSSSQNTLAITQPYISQQGRKMEPSFCLYVGYNFKVWPLWAGGLNGNGEYEFLIGTSLALKQINAYSLYRSSADITFTG